MTVSENGSVAIDTQQVQALRAHRLDIRRRLGLAAGDAPVFTVPPLAGNDDGHFRAGWATLLLRKGGIPARLLLPGPNREARRVRRFAASCGEHEAIAVAAAGTPWTECLAAGDGLIVPSAALFDAPVVAWAMAAGLPIVTTQAYPPLLAAGACVISAGPEPLNLARALLRAWQDRHS